MHKINTELAVKYLVEELNLKNEVALAEKLKITKNALSMLKKRNSLGTLIEKVLIHIDVNISLDRLIYGHSSSCFEAQVLAKKNQKEDVLASVLQNFIDSQTIMFGLKEKIQRIKGQTFVEKLLISLNGDAERMLILLYAFLNHLEKSKIQTSENLNSKFVTALKEFPFSKINGLKYGVILKDRDFKQLENFANEELDNVSIGEILMVLAELKSFIKDRLVLKVDDVTIKSLEKIFS